MANPPLLESRHHSREVRPSLLHVRFNAELPSGADALRRRRIPTLLGGMS